MLPSHCAWSPWWRWHRPGWLSARRAASLPGWCAPPPPASRTPSYPGWRTKYPPEENTREAKCVRDREREEEQGEQESASSRLGWYAHIWRKDIKTVETYHNVCVVTLLNTLSKPGVSTIALINCLIVFIDIEAIFNSWLIQPMSNFCLLPTGNCSVP